MSATKPNPTVAALERAHAASERCEKARRLDVAYENFPPEISPIVGDLVVRFLWLIPAWCTRLLVVWDVNAAPNSPAKVATSFKHRQITLHIHPAFLDEAPQRRIERLAHEFSHALTCPLVDAVQEAIERMFEKADPRLAAELHAMVREHDEGVAQDFSRAVCRVMEAIP